MVRMVEEAFRAVGGVEHAGDARAAHPRLPRARQLRLQGQRRAAASRRAAADGRAGALRLRAPRPSAGDLRPGEAEERRADSGGARATSSSTRSTSATPARTAMSGSIVQGGLYNTLIRALQQFGLADAFGASDAADAGAQRHVPARAGRDRRLLRRQARRAGRRGRPARVHRARHLADAAPPARHPTPLHGKDMLQMAGEYTGRGDRRRARGVRRASSARRRRGAGRALARRQRRAPRRESPRARAAAARAAAGLLHRLPRAAGVRGAEARAAGRRPGAHRRRHRLPRVRDLRAVLVGPFDPRLRHEPGASRAGVVADDEAA